YEGWFSIADRSKSVRIDVVRCRHQWGLSSPCYGVGPVSEITRIRALSGVAGLVGKRVQIGIESLIHPRVAPLVGAADHREPLRTSLVIYSTEDLCGVGRPISDHHEHRVFHSADRTGDARRLRVR